ncbi:hypothetical protein O0J72_15260 [Stenotrophomonas sp. Sm3212]|nr:hypothetical protein [Stenotrophomonas sp. Sm3212]
MRAPRAAAPGAIRRTCAEQGLHMLVQKMLGFFRLQAGALPQLQVQLLVMARQRRGRCPG